MIGKKRDLYKGQYYHGFCFYFSLLYADFITFKCCYYGNFQFLSAVIFVDVITFVAVLYVITLLSFYVIMFDHFLRMISFFVLIFYHFLLSFLNVLISGFLIISPHFLCVAIVTQPLKTKTFKINFLLVFLRRRNINVPSVPGDHLQEVPS
jgi:hypothetical protein